MSLQTLTYIGLSIAALGIVCQYKKLKKLYIALTFFDKKNIVHNFRTITSLGWPYATAHKGDKVAKFEQNCLMPLPYTFTFKNNTYNLEHWLKNYWTTGLVVLKIESPTKAKLLFESYYLGNTPQTKTISWSINKSVVSALIGIAISEGKISSVNDYVTTYAPQLLGSGYDGVIIKDVLQMSSGVNFDEDYANLNSDINKMSFWLSYGWNMDDFIKTLYRNTNPGTKHDYISSDTQVLGMVLKGAIGKSLTSYLEEKILQPCGFESDCDWLLDNETSKMELAFGTLNTSTRDYARFGWLYLNKGLSPLDGSTIINSEWIDESHLKPSRFDNLGYGYQWWLPGQDTNQFGIKSEIQGDYLAIGVYNQFIYIDPVSNIVIAMNSANPNYNEQTDKYGTNIGELEAIAAFREIAKHYH